MAVENKMEINQYGTAFVANFTWVMRYLLTPQTPHEVVAFYARYTK